ncbi:hypothetical protein NLJ89_g4141 [Agrocybe chaxingu]|uniref:Bromo domain-containing protein n=1 Tax=Agrocybe chaxingu TaxID=84603 RepID=A0A9W8MWT0_9AGAR|nr:hypothetical protein NLJ89_g4141 [Agrocybe chaxingu]
MPHPIDAKKVNGAHSGRPEQVKEQGLKIWTAVKDAVKDGRSLSYDFLHKPPRRDYPDYYELIKHPIALDDIKKRLDNGSYASLGALKDDFELLVENAKQYNMAESQIVQDAKELLRIVHRLYRKMVPNGDDEENVNSLEHSMKTRIDKLIKKKGLGDRVLSTEFMDFPDRKLWSSYYKTIKKPQCFNNVQQRIKNKEYHTSAQFAADVELIFSNAMTFNLEHTQIWEDALTLRDTFRQLMSDLPPPHALQEYTKPSNKIKIRRPQPAQPTASTSTTQPAKHESGSSSLLLRVPAAHPATSAKTASQAPAIAPAPPPPTLPVAPNKVAPKASTPAPPKASTPQVQAQVKRATPQPPVQTVSFINATPLHYPQTAQPACVPPAPVVAPSTTAAPPVLRPSSAVNAHSTSHSPAPVVLPLSHQLKSVTLRIQPRDRVLTLDRRDGVKSWAVRLVPGETSVLVSDVTYMQDDEDDSSDEEDADADKHEKDEDDMDVDVEKETPSPPRNGKKKGKARARGRPPKASTVAAKAAQAAAAAKAEKAAKKKAVAKLGEIQLKLNTFVVKEQPEKPGEWSVYLPVGSNVIEVGEIGGMIWKVYAERLGDV